VTDRGEEISCAQLLDGTRQPDEQELQIAQQTELPLPQAEGDAPLLVQVPQDRYLFLARAHDRFGFMVAQGCEAETVTSQRVLVLQIALTAIAAPSGRLEVTGPTSWLQPAGSPGLEGAPALAVRSLDERGQPQPGVEVRVLVESGSALPLEERFWTSGADARGSTVCLVGEGPTRVLLHARGLEGSPLAFDLEGLPSPDFTAFNIDEPGQVPLAIFKGDVYVDDQAADDLGVVLVEPTLGQGRAHYWAGGREGAAGWGVENPDLLSWQDGASWFRPTHVAAGYFDDDCIDATGPCVQLGDVVVAGVEPQIGTPGLFIHHHSTFAGDRLRSAIPEVLPGDVSAIEQLLTLRVNHDELDDVAVVVTTAGASTSVEHFILIFSTQRAPPNENEPALVLRQRLVIPDPLDDNEPERVYAADMDGDGDDELLISYDFLGLFIVPCLGELGDGATPYVTAAAVPDAWPQLATFWGFNLVATGDVDGDGLVDILVVNIPENILNEPSLRVAFGNGALETCPVTAPGCGALAFDDPRPLDLATLGNVEQILLGDLNGDGHIDLLTAGAERAAILAGDGSGRFSSPLVIPLYLQSLVAIAAAPLDLDAAEDLGFLGADLEGEAVFKVRMTGGI